MKKRLDVLVFEKGFAESRERAKAIIMAGEIYVDNQKADKCGQSYNEDVNIEFRGTAPKYVSRNGGYTRIVKIGLRKGDNAMEVLLELV